MFNLEFKSKEEIKETFAVFWSGPFGEFLKVACMAISFFWFCFGCLYIAHLVSHGFASIQGHLFGMTGLFQGFAWVFIKTFMRKKKQ